MEVSGLHRHTMKYLSVFVLAIGVFGVVTSLPFMALDLANGAGIAMGDLAGVIGGTALIVPKCADYIARTNPSDRNGDKERPVERVRSRVSAPMAV